MVLSAELVSPKNKKGVQRRNAGPFLFLKLFRLNLLLKSYMRGFPVTRKKE